jgi:hypothetical protein
MPNIEFQFKPYNTFNHPITYPYFKANKKYV